MRFRLQLSLILLFPVAGSMGCASSPLRPFKWLRHRSAQFQLAQNSNAHALTNDPVPTTDALSSAPPKLPAGIELPPEPEVHVETQPSGAIQPPETSALGVIFASTESN